MAEAPKATDNKIETTDSWPIKKIIKHIILPKPKGSPKGGKKEWAARIIVVMIIGFVWLAFSGSKSLPSCASSNAKRTLQKAFDGSPLAKTAGLSAITIENIKDISGDGKRTRECGATILLNNTMKQDVRYYMETKDGGNYMLTFIGK